MKDWFILTAKSAAMQRLADLVRTGHTRYVCGRVPIDRAAHFIEKIDALHEVGLSKLEQSRKRKKGLASARLIVLAPTKTDAQHIDFWLLMSDGSINAESNERWRDALTDRITHTNYELVRHTRSGSKKPAWTWRYTREQHQTLRDELVRVIRARQDHELVQMIAVIAKTPGFAGARVQVKDMMQLIRSEWQRRRKDDAMPALPARIGYIRRLPDVGMKISVLRAK